MECLNNLINHPISIHAPREGCDRKAFKSISKAKHFNPRTPRGVRQGPSGRCSRDSDNFNPRTPRGVRPRPPPSLCHSQSISIHAPREGCDRYPTPLLRQPPNFNPRTPRGVRLDSAEKLFLPHIRISIHAPREGCDSALGTTTTVKLEFQSTHPARGATMSTRAFNARLKFQSTHPARGATRVANLNGVSHKFQSTHPARGATGAQARQRGRAGISIHAPREGCDPPLLPPDAPFPSISIHAPREGCDYLL